MRPSWMVRYKGLVNWSPRSLCSSIGNKCRLKQNLAYGATFEQRIKDARFCRYRIFRRSTVYLSLILMERRLSNIFKLWIWLGKYVDNCFLCTISCILRQFVTFPFLYFVWIMLWWLSDIALDHNYLPSSPFHACFLLKWTSTQAGTGMVLFCRTAWMRIGGNLIYFLHNRCAQQIKISRHYKSLRNDQ